MSEHSHISGKTPDQARRSDEAAQRQAVREQRSAEEQLELIAQRPGKSAKERQKLMRAQDYV